MSILTASELLLVFDPDRIRQLASDQSQQHGKITYNEAIVTAILNQVEGLVKNSLSLQYSTTELEADYGIKRMVADIAMYYLEIRRPPPTVETTQLYKAAALFLAALQQGTAKLSAVQQLLPSGPSTAPVEAISTDFFSLTSEEQAEVTAAR